MSWKGEVGCVGVLRVGREQEVSDRHPYEGQAGVARSGRKLLELLLLGNLYSQVHTPAVCCVSGILFATTFNLKADPGAWPPSLFRLCPCLRLDSDSDQILSISRLEGSAMFQYSAKPKLLEMWLLAYLLA